jgi:hypothetical protein
MKFSLLGFAGTTHARIVIRKNRADFCTGDARSCISGRRSSKFSLPPQNATRANTSGWAFRLDGPWRMTYFSQGQSALVGRIPVVPGRAELRPEPAAYTRCRRPAARRHSYGVSATSFPRSGRNRCSYAPTLVPSHAGYRFAPAYRPGESLRRACKRCRRPRDS